MKFLDVYWFTSLTASVGIVRVLDEYEGFLYFIKSVEGLNEQDDILNIMNWGSRFPKDAGDCLFGITNA